jgi:tetratricopeptide (TPR) repeat protein
MTSSTPNIETKAGRARRGIGQLWQVPAFVVGLLTLLGAALSAPWRHPPEWWEFEEQIVTLRRGLDKNMPPDELVAHAEAARARLYLFPERSAEGHFLIGSAYYRQAKQKPAAAALGVWPRAIEDIEQALSLPLAAADRPAAHYRLGYALYQMGADVPRALDLMTQAVDKGADQPLQGYLLLVQANLKLTPPNVDAALTASRRVLDLTPESSIEALTLARLMHGELLLRKDLRTDALKELEQIGPRAPTALRVKARLLQARACEEDGQLGRAVALWQELLKNHEQVEGGKSRVYYEMGWCYHRMEPRKLADTIKVWTEALRLGGPAGQAAGLRLGEMRLSLGEKESRQALDNWQQAMREVSSPVDWQNPYLELADVQKMLEDGLKLFQDKQDPQKAQKVAELLGKIAPGGEADDKLAMAHQARAIQLQKQKESPEIVASHFLMAAQAFEKALKAHPDAARMWRCIQCFLSAKEMQRAQDLLQQYVKLELDDEHKGEAWFTLGDLYRSLDSKVSDRAHRAFIKGLEYEKSSFANKTRYWLAVEQIDKKNYDRAKDILDDIFLPKNNADLDRACHEKALYQLGALLIKMKNYGEARISLTQFIRIYGENPNVILARLELGECYSSLAKKEFEHERHTDDLLQRADEADRPGLDRKKRHHHNLGVEHLGEAIKTYQGLAEDLRARAIDRAGPLSLNELIVLRRAYFGLGQCHFDRNEYEEGLRVFQKLQEEYRQTLESLYAGLRICNLAEVFREPRERARRYQESAAKSLHLIKDDLQAMNSEHEVFKMPGVSSRENWLDWADKMEKKLAAPAKQVSPSGLFP